MKITKIEIKDFHQFKNFSIDLTYPKGHEKEGQPLDKVCFIGQSGTGKTTLLELIPVLMYNYKTNLIEKIGVRTIVDKIKISLKFGRKNEYEVDLKAFANKETLKTGTNWSNGKLFKEQFPTKDIVNIFKNEWSKNTSTKLMYFPANLNFDLDFDSEGFIEDKKIIDFSVEKISLVWNLILDEIKKYHEEEMQIRQEISKTVEQASNDLQTIQNALKKLENWKKTEFNPIQDVADNCLDKILENYKLKIKTEFDIKIKEDIGFVKIEDYNRNEIPYGLWSTGTKQVVLSALPLYLLKPKHTVILFDEPERSLYPDLQRMIIDFYSSLTEDCQFFYSTHSPIIASSFDPWEIVELKFNEQGNIYRETYYEGENHIDNYKWNPKFMRWDDILQRVFDLQDDGSPARKEKLDKLATYNVKYKKLKKSGDIDSPEAKKIISGIEKLSKELSNWD